MSSKPRELMLALTLALSLSGCALFPSYKPVTLDSASPIPGDVKRCGQQLSGKCIALVRADQWTSKTGVMVKANEAYCVRVLPDQVWFDADRRNTAPRGERGSWIMNRHIKRHPESDFFSLMINTQLNAVAPGAPGAAGALPVIAMGMDLGASRPGAPYVTPVDGELVLYPNDAMGPAGAQTHWYKNNSGQIWVEISRCTAPAAQASQ